MFSWTSSTAPCLSVTMTSWPSLRPWRDMSSMWDGCFLLENKLVFKAENVMLCMCMCMQRDREHVRLDPDADRGVALVQFGHFNTNSIKGTKDLQEGEVGMVKNFESNLTQANNSCVFFPYHLVARNTTTTLGSMSCLQWNWPLKNGDLPQLL